MSAPPLLDVRGIARRLGSHQALDDISFSLASGDILGIIGRSGAGKSTLIRCLSGLERVDGGSITVEGTEITALSETALQTVRQRIGMIFQHFNLLSAKTAAENVMLPLLIAGWPKRRREERVAELLDLVGLGGQAKRYPHQLSGGQKQRVGIARALAASPALLLCDEATSALDPETTTSILALLDDINRRLGVTMVLITHEMSVIRSLARKVIVLDHGRIAEQGSVAEIFGAPRSDVTHSLLRGFRPELPDHLAAALRPEPFPGSAPLFRIDLAGENARGTLLFDLAQSFRVRPVLLHGGLQDVRGVAVGSLFVALADAGAAPVDAILSFLLGRSQATELLGHVVPSA
ncbi:methionine ABC transporter ATP-binding protein [Acidisoma silvae]|uniref:methionine ABC transporter ATP-binding protein n=1 Tax=Acidisoma silvae TaxID=2802396 RepID=UPI001D0A1453|nr:methionine ABC transporter ATP-binding protein [Acidisoma silvae]